MRESSWVRRVWPIAAGAAAMAVAGAIRVRPLLAGRPLSYDEGVYGVSVLALREGALPFREVFSSQGPLYLPVLWAFDTLGLRHFRAVRFGMVVVALAIALGAYLVGRRLATPFPAAVAAAIAATSAASVLAAGAIQSDGIALAFAVWAVAVVLGVGGLERSRPVVAGLLIGAGMATKSLFLVPAGLAVAWWFASRREWRRLGLAAGSAALLGLAVTLPWGLGNVWDQFVSFQLAVPRDRLPVKNLIDNVGRMWRRDSLVLMASAATLVVGLWRLVRWRRPEGPRAEQAVLLVWLVASAVVLLAGMELDRGSYRFLAFFFVPAMLTFAALRPPLAVVVAVAVAAGALVPRHLHENRDLLGAGRASSTQREVVARLEALPDGAQVITDNQGIAWFAERHPPPFLVDTSWARIQSGYLTDDDILAGAAEPEVCAVLFYTNRFDFMDPRMEERLAGYAPAAQWGEDRRLWVKDECSPGGSAQS